jgi:hypothetical protein
LEEQQPVRKICIYWPLTKDISEGVGGERGKGGVGSKSIVVIEDSVVSDGVVDTDDGVGVREDSRGIDEGPAHSLEISLLER